MTEQNRHAMVELAMEAIYLCEDWDDVAAYFGITIPVGDESEAQPIVVPLPGSIMGGESNGHAALKQHVAGHPELFERIRSGQAQWNTCWTRVMRSMSSSPTTIRCWVWR